MKTKRWYKIKRMVKLTTFVRTQIIGQSAELQTLAAVVRFHSSVPYGYGARLVEQLAFNQLDAGSTPVVPTIIRINLFANKEPRRRLPGARTCLHARLTKW